MNLRKIFRRTAAALLIVTCLLTAAVVGAAVQIFDGRGECEMGDFAPIKTARDRAAQRAQLDAQKKAGVYLKTFSRSVNASLTDDEVSAVTNNIIELVGAVQYENKTFQLTDQTTAVVVVATLKAKIDPEGIYAFIKRDDKEKVTIVQQNTGLQDAIAKNDKEFEDLKEQYKRATSQGEKNRIHEHMNKVNEILLAQQKLEEGNRLYYDGDYDKAIQSYKEALNFGEYDTLHYNIGTSYFNLKNYALAIQHLNKAIQLNPNYAEAYNNRGVVYMDGLNKCEQAISDFDKAIKLNTNVAEVYFNRGNAYKNLNQYERAIKDYNKALALNPNDSDVYCNRGVAYSQSGQYEQAIRDFSKALLLNPNDAEVYSNRGVAYLRIGNCNQAIQDFDKSLAINPNYFTVYSDRGTAYIKLRQYDKAILSYNEALKLNPNSVEVYTNRGVAHSMSMNFEQAIFDATKAIQINPNYVNAYVLRALCYQQLGDNAKAQADFAKAKELGYKG